MPSTPSERFHEDRLQNAGPGEPVDVWIYCAFPKDNWVARRHGDRICAEHPGTAIQIGNDLFEILRAEETREPGYVIRYGLKRWDAKHAVRLLLHYTPETQARSAADYLAEERRQKLRTCILWLLPLAGMAPDPLQREWEEKTALNMKWLSAASAAASVLVCMALVIIFGDRFDFTHPFYFVVSFFAIEAAIRPFWILLSGTPHGTLALTLPYLLWEAVARPEKRRPKAAVQLNSLFEEDEVIRRPSMGRLLVRSMLFDDMLAGPNPILFEGVVYMPGHWYEEGKGLSRRLVYELEKIDPDPKAKYREYTQPRAPERQKLVEAYTRSRDRVHSFALVWGTYPRGDQLRLGAKYHYAAAKCTGITATLLLACAALQFCAGLILHSTIYSLLAPVYLASESVYRLYEAKVHGLPTASFAGYVLKVFLQPPP